MGVLIYSDMLQLSALEQAQAIKNRDVSSVELVNAYLARIEAHNPALNAFVTVQSRRAKRAARLADRAVKRTEPSRLPAFHGVPTGIKDHGPTAWSPTKRGSRAYP